MRKAILAAVVLMGLSGGCASTPSPRPAPPPEPRPGDSVHIRGRLDADVDCRLLRTEEGRVYSLSVRLPNLRDGSQVCIYGTISQGSCIHSPSIEVDQVKPWSSCP